MHAALARPIAALSILFGLPVLALTAASSRPSEAEQGEGSTILTVDFRALTRDGSPILDLKAEEVVLRVGGRARDIMALELMRAVSPESASSKAPAPMPPPFATNSPPAGGRDVLLVVDEEAMAPGGETAVRNALGQLVSALSPIDRVALMPVKGGPALTSLTTRHDRVAAAIAALTGRAAAQETASDATCRARTNLFTLLGVFESIAVSVPTAVVFVSNGFTSPTAIESIARGSGPAGPCEITTGDLETLSRAAVASRAHVFVLQVIDDAASGAATRTTMVAGLEYLAGLTGNAVVRLIGGSERAVKRIASETSAYYVAAFEVPAEERTGGTHRVEVTVARQGVEVRARPTLVIPNATAKPAKTNPPKPREMLGATKIFRALPLRAIAYTSRLSPDGRLRVIVVFEPGDPSLRLAEAAVALFDGSGKARAQWTAQPAELKQTPVIAALNGPAPGSYRVRVAAVDASGDGGTVDQDITVNAGKQETASVGDVVLGAQAANSFAPRLQFVSEPAAVALVEVLGPPKTAKVSAIFELAGSEDGPAVATLQGTVPAPREGLWTAFVVLPIGPMPPGDLVVRAVVSVDGQPLAARPFRTLRKVAR